VFVPLHDDTPLRVIRFQLVTFIIIAANIVLFLVTAAFQADQVIAAVATGYGVVPVDLTDPATRVGSGFQPVAEPVTFLTYMFLHGSWMHLISNMLFLWVFGDNVEDAFGHVGFALFYLLCGIAAALTHVLFNLGSNMPMIGASGAVSGVMAAYLLLYPRARVWVLILLRLPLRISALWALGGWLAFQLINVVLSAGKATEVAFWAHIGGFAAGLILTYLLRSRLLIRVGD
jgi:membrane associated rhomboid family serine protease